MNLSRRSHRFCSLPCEQANAAGAPGVPDRRAVDGSRCKSRKTHARCSGVVFLLSKNLSQVGKQIVAVPVPKILVGIVVPVAYRRQATARVDVHFPVPQIQEQNVEVSKEIPQEQLAERIMEQIVDVPVSQSLEQIVDVPVPQITEETVEVATQIPQAEETVNVLLLHIQEQIVAVVKAVPSRGETDRSPRRAQPVACARARAQLLQGQYFFAESVCRDDAPGLLRCVPFLDEGHLWRTVKTHATISLFHQGWAFFLSIQLFIPWLVLCCLRFNDAHDVVSNVSSRTLIDV